MQTDPNLVIQSLLRQVTDLVSKVAFLEATLSAPAEPNVAKPDEGVSDQSDDQ